MRKYLFLLAATLALGACNRKIDFGPDEGVSYRNAMNVPIGYTDNSDWTLDGSWNKQERQLFEELSVNVNAATQGQVSSLGFFPNPLQPGSNGTLLYQTAQQNMRLHLVFVDKKYKIIDRQDRPVDTGGRYGTELPLPFPSAKFASNTIYRLYYIFYAPDGTLYYKGHGDIKIAE